MWASSSSTVRGELPRPARLCHISKVFHSTKARKHEAGSADVIRSELVGPSHCSGVDESEPGRLGARRREL
jgi:hypothetical protein